MNPDNDFDLGGRIAVVSGASRGIGRAIAIKLAQHGAHVIVTSRKAESCEPVAAEIVAAGGSAAAFGCHIGDLDRIAALYAYVDATQDGRIDILVNNAATNPVFGPAVDTDPAAFQKTVDVNLRGYFYMTVGAARRMQPRRRGAIVNVASVNAVRPALHQVVYSMTKAGIVNMTEGFAKELAPHGIRVNALLPGLTETKFAAALHQNPSIRREVEAGLPMGRIAQPGELAGAALYLVSDAASYTTGSSLVVDGGYLT